MTLNYRNFTVKLIRAQKDTDEEPEEENTPANEPEEGGIPEEEGDGAADTAGGGDVWEVEGLAVPYDTETEIFEGFHEVIARGAVCEPEDSTVLLFWRHDEPIGTVIESNNLNDGYHVRARISQTPRGAEAYQLLKDGVITRMSIGFEPLEWVDEENKERMLRTQTQIMVREVSLVPFPAYQDAAVETVRQATKQKPTVKENTMTSTTTVNREDLDEIRSQITDLSRDVAMTRAQGHFQVTERDNRSAGAFLKDLVAGDNATRAAYEEIQKRAWDGTKIADDALAQAPMWTKDLVAIYEAEDYIGRHFNQGTLGSSGLTAEFVTINTNTLTVAEQVNEGDDLVFGKMSTQVSSSSIKTFGGYTSLSQKEIERGSASLLTKQLQALSMAAGFASAVQFEADFKAAVTAQAEKKLTYSKALNTWTWTDIVQFLIKAIDTFRSVHMPLDGMIVDPVVFSALASMVDGNDNPRMTITGTNSPGTTVGSIDTSSLTGQLGNLLVQPFWGMQAGALGDGVNAVLFSKQAMTRYQTAVTELQDANIVNLTRQYSVYRYGMNAVEMPAGLIPLSLGNQSTTAPAAATPAANSETTPAANSGTTPAAS